MHLLAVSHQPCPGALYLRAGWLTSWMPLQYRSVSRRSSGGRVGSEDAAAAAALMRRTLSAWHEMV